MSQAFVKKGFVVAIDGPSGTGKSTASRMLADRLGFVYVDTGALYRALGYLTLQQLPESGEWERVDQDLEIAQKIAPETELEFRLMPRKNPRNRIFANGKDVTNYIRSLDVSMAASRISMVPFVRQCLFDFQRILGAKGSSILEGRDIGTVIFPDADIKFFLTASLSVRAQRRFAEIEASGGEVPTLIELERQMQERDEQDSRRAVAPLKPAKDAIFVDTSVLTFEEVLNTMELKIREKLSAFKGN